MQNFLKELINYSNCLHEKLDLVKDSLYNNECDFNQCCKDYNKQVTREEMISEKETQEKIIYRERLKNWNERKRDLEDLDKIFIQFIERTQSVIRRIEHRKFSLKRP